MVLSWTDVALSKEETVRMSKSKRLKNPKLNVYEGESDSATAAAIAILSIMIAGAVGCMLIIAYHVPLW